MFIDNYFGYEQKVWDEATAKATLETKKAAIKSFFSNGVSVELISKSMNMSPEEIRAILKETH